MEMESLNENRKIIFSLTVCFLFHMSKFEIYFLVASATGNTISYNDGFSS